MNGKPTGKEEEKETKQTGQEKGTHEKKNNPAGSKTVRLLIYDEGQLQEAETIVCQLTTSNGDR